MSLGLLLDCLTQSSHDSSGGKRFYTHEIKLLATKKRRKALKEHLVEPARFANLPQIRCRKFLRHDIELDKTATSNGNHFLSFFLLLLIELVIREGKFKKFYSG